MASGKNGVEGSFRSPDFAYPQTVMANADAELSEALSEGRPVPALTAAMQKNVAIGRISVDSCGVQAALFEKLAETLPHPYSNLALLMEAVLYSDIYKADRWQYDSRVLPSGSWPEDIKAWNRDLFSRKVCGLVAGAFEDTGDAADMSVREITPIVAGSDEAAEEKMSVLDFMTFVGAGLLDGFAPQGNETIPFGYGAAKGNKDTEVTAMQLRARLLDEAIRRREAAGPSATLVKFMKLKYESLPASQREAYLEECIGKLIGSDYCAPLLAFSVDTSGEDISKYRRIADYIAAHPDGYGIGVLKRQKAEFENPSVCIESPRQGIAGRTVSAGYNVKNIDRFYILAVRMPARNPESPRVRIDELRRQGAVADKAEVVTGEKIPFAVSDSVTFTLSTPGSYAFVASSTPDMSGIMVFNNSTANMTFPTTLVSGMAALLSYQETDPESGRLYIVDAVDQRPLKGVKIVLTPNGSWRGKGDKKTVTGVTNDEGYIRIYSNNYTLKASRANDTFVSNLWLGFNKDRIGTDIRCRIFTDLSIYHPGDTVEFAGVFWTRDDKNLHALAVPEADVVLRDANYQEVGRTRVTSDATGRFSGRFVLPASGLLGRFSIALDKKNCYAVAGFDVAEYKSPTFRVVTEGAESEFSVGDVVKISGKAETYSGMPVAGAKVAFDVRYVPLYWFRFGQPGGNANYGGTTVTGSDGRFTIELPTEGLLGTPYARGRYELNVAVTDAAGETREAPLSHFSLGRGYTIVSDIPARIELTDTLKSGEYAVRVLDILGFPTRKEVYYRVTDIDTGAGVASGSFISPAFSFDAAKAGPGAYRIEFSLSSDMKENDESLNAEAKTVVWSTASSVPPCRTMLWVPRERVIVPENRKEVDVEFGSSYPDSFVLVTMASTVNVLKREWIRVSGENRSVRVTVPSGQERLFVTFAAMRDLGTSVQTVALIPERQTRELNIEAESFRDRLDPGAREQWRFRFTLDDKELAGLPVMAVMSNKALNALAPFSWAFNPWSELSWNRSGTLDYVYHGGDWSKCVSNIIKDKYQAVNYRVPAFNMYGLGLYGNSSVKYHSRTLRIRGTGVMAKEEAANDMDTQLEDNTVVMMSEMKMAAASQTTEAVAEAGSAPDGDAGSAAKPEDDSVPLREVECPLAFFMPELTTGSDGMAAVDFTVPDFNGTWQFQIMGWTPDMRGAVWRQDAVASKPVMVQMNAPRFVRSGDTVTFAATVYNNGTGEVPVYGRLEVFNPLTGAVVASFSQTPEETAASASRVVRLEFKVPGECDMLGFRAYACGGNHIDGEQTVIPVLPSSTPVTEATPFWMQPGQREMTLRIPEAPKGSRLTLTYVDNPVWECVTALPAISTPESENVLAQVSALYGNAIAAGLLKDYPELRTAISAFADPLLSGDSTLVSNLEKNASLKTVALNNTPWVRDAGSETLRMQSLVEYCDPGKGRAAIESAMSMLKKRQHADGGWSWCEGMPSSEFITGRVALHLAMLGGMGYMPDGGAEMARKAIAYCDGEIVKDVERAGSRNFNYASLLDYLYIRSFFSDVSASARFSAIKSKALAAITADWKNDGIYRKATAAMLLWRENSRSVAREILESLRQYATVTPEKGMWFNRLDSSSGGWNKLITTTQVLEAYNEISPDNEAVDRLRQWLVLTKQTENWGDARETAEVIHAILTSGTKWTAPSSAPAVKIASKTNGGEAVDARTLTFPQTAHLTGSFTINMDDAHGFLQIIRDGAGPAWGGIVNQYEREITDVKQYGTPQISIEKNIYSVSTDSDGTSAVEGSLKTGDRVRVTLTIRCDRDMEYVAVTDARSACLEPADQISGYSQSDGVWMYREVRNDAVNLFIPFLGKGTHVVSYDCFVDRSGVYTLGIAEAQSQYSPVFAAHSAGRVITVE